MTLGELIEALRACQKDAVVQFDFPSYWEPDELISYRGYHNQPCITFRQIDYDSARLAHEFADYLENALEETHLGYKGGEYRYNADHQPYVANYSLTSDVKVVGISDQFWRAVILTEYQP